MSKKDHRLSAALRETAARLDSGARYEWGHMGRCNCGHLVQTITSMTDQEIVRSIDFQLDEWTEHAKDYCEGTGHKVDDLFLALDDVGFDHQDVIHLEYLSDQTVLNQIGADRLPLQRNRREDVVLYLNTLASLVSEG